jgi:hypothetical protein
VVIGRHPEPVSLFRDPSLARYGSVPTTRTDVMRSDPSNKYKNSTVYTVTAYEFPTPEIAKRALLDVHGQLARQDAGSEIQPRSADDDPILTHGDTLDLWRSGRVVVRTFVEPTSTFDAGTPTSKDQVAITACLAPTGRITPATAEVSIGIDMAKTATCLSKIGAFDVLNTPSESAPGFVINPTGGIVPDVYGQWTIGETTSGDSDAYEDVLVFWDPAQAARFAADTKLRGEAANDAQDSDTTAGNAGTNGHLNSIQTDGNVVRIQWGTPTNPETAQRISDCLTVPSGGSTQAASPRTNPAPATTTSASGPTDSMNTMSADATLAALKAFLRTSRRGYEATKRGDWQAAADNRTALASQALHLKDTAASQYATLIDEFEDAMQLGATANEKSITCGSIKVPGPCAAQAHQLAHDAKATFRADLNQALAEHGDDPVPDNSF